jgi:hypothetical protein
LSNIATKNGIIYIIDSIENIISDTDIFLGIIFSTGHKTIVVKKEYFHDNFYNLKTGFAGEILQKASNYGFRLIILGDFSNIDSRSLRDFIYESNKTGKVIFHNKLENAIDLLQ